MSSPGLLKNGKINICTSTGSQENNQNKVNTQLWDTLYVCIYFLKKVICRYLLTLANDAKLGWPAAIFPFLSSSKAFWTAYMILSRRMAARLSTCGEGEIGVLQCTLTNLLCNLRILLHSSILYQTCRRCLTMF